MALHRCLMLGSGFHDWMMRTKSPDDVSEAMAATNLNDKPAVRPIPVVNLLDVSDDAYIDALVKEALPADQVRFRQYMVNRPLGLGIITAGPGFGKTTALAAATLGMCATVGKVLCCGPSNVSVDNFADRLNRVTRSVSARYNEGKPEGDNSRSRHQFVIRAFKINREVEAALHLLAKPDETDMTFLSRGWGRKTKWQPHLSVAVWMLVLLRSQAKCVWTLHSDDSEWLHRKQRTLDTENHMSLLRDIARGKEDYKPQFATPIKKLLTKLAVELVQAADLLCTTASASTKEDIFAMWKENLARGVAFDEAANMDRADLADVWGNTLLPCLMGGDPKQLPPTVMTRDEKDKRGNLFNRFSHDGGISALDFQQAAGYPVYRLVTQLRMGNGLFDWVAELIYPDVPLTYSSLCQIDQPKFALGHNLEDFIRSKYPEVKAPPANKFWPVFLSCENGRVFVDRNTGSKQSKDQVKVALDFALDFVTVKNVNPAKITIISPYAANVDYLSRMRKQPEYAALEGMPQASSVDGFQGQENDIMIVVMGTAFPQPGAGFTSNPQRLNVMLTRQRCGLVVVGHIKMPGVVDDGEEDEGKGKGKGKGKRKGKGPVKGKKERIMTLNEEGEMVWMVVTVLKEMYKRMYTNGRVATVTIAK
ncbi:DNA helicase [Colletotrichum tofieldiae]|nr:DNA helicase [Colletotrichum tofieldiae]GKT78847.1 DNA helicase [Colletotrichum tofieldiae]GKT86940.1 DNA helicase [Colletotrichum tofieldiae]